MAQSIAADVFKVFVGKLADAGVSKLFDQIGLGDNKQEVINKGIEQILNELQTLGEKVDKIAMQTAEILAKVDELSYYVKYGAKITDLTYFCKKYAECAKTNFASDVVVNDLADAVIKDLKMDMILDTMDEILSKYDFQPDLEALKLSLKDGCAPSDYFYVQMRTTYLFGLELQGFIIHAHMLEVKGRSGESAEVMSKAVVKIKAQYEHIENVLKGCSIFTINPNNNDSHFSIDPNRSAFLDLHDVKTDYPMAGVQLYEKGNRLAIKIKYWNSDCEWRGGQLCATGKSACENTELGDRRGIDFWSNQFWIMDSVPTRVPDPSRHVVKGVRLLYKEDTFALGIWYSERGPGKTLYFQGPPFDGAGKAKFDLVGSRKHVITAGPPRTDSHTPWDVFSGTPSVGLTFAACVGVYDVDTSCVEMREPGWVTGVGLYWSEGAQMKAQRKRVSVFMETRFS